MKTFTSDQARAAGTPALVMPFPRQLTRVDRTAVEDLIEQLIGQLDEVDGDADREPDECDREDGGDCEPSEIEVRT